MARYYTDTEELTSIANAIRTKTGGSSSLVYPTGFVSEINELTKYNWIGKDAELVSTVYDDEIVLSDTTLGSWTPSTSTTTVFDGTKQNATAVTVNNEYDYMVITDCYTTLAYTGTPSNPRVLEHYSSSYESVCSRPSSYNDWVSDLKATYSYDSNVTHYLNICINSSGVSRISINSVGLYTIGNHPNVNTSSYPSVTITARLPNIRVATSNDYMPATAFQELDLNNSKTHITIKVYRTAHDGMWQGAWETFRKMYNTVHNIT